MIKRNTTYAKDALKFSKDISAIHFIGIGGIGMSGIAEVLQSLGYTVQGSDLSENANVERLRKKGVTVFKGHSEENVKNASVVVKSSAVKDTNPELKAARESKIPVVRRAEMLAELMRFKSAIAVAGTHGKTTTTSLIATVLEAGHLEPTIINGGVINAYGTNARHGTGDWMVVEADESDGTFNRLPADVAIVTNIDPEHLDHYGDFQTLKDAFKTFVSNIPFYGFAVMCTDHPVVQTLVGQIEDRRIITYGENPQADIQLINITAARGKMRFSARIRNIRRHEGVECSDRTVDEIELPMPGKHNVLNAGAAIGVAQMLGLGDEDMKRGLAEFRGVNRRFTHIGTHQGVTYIDDYGHHPVEISAVLKAARGTTDGKVIAVVQPHRYTRLRDLFEEFCTCFNDADTVVVTPVYEAGETLIEGATHHDLIAGLKTRGHRHVIPASGPEDLPATLNANVKDGDLVVFLGAGNISAWGYQTFETMRGLSK